MNKIILIIPYFGAFNNYFELWLESAKKNSRVDFLIVTDNNKLQELTCNIIWKEMNFQEIIEKINEIVCEFKPKIKEPYKLCEYKPLYGKIFKEYIMGYEFWGYCDIDLIFGNFDSFINEKKLEKFDKFYNRGHLTFYRNNDFFENLYKYEDCRMPVTYKEAWTTNYCCHFDEMPIWDTIIEENGYRCYNDIDFADIDIKSYRFQLAMGKDAANAKQLYYKNGERLYRYYIDGKLNKKEILYVHLQKRTMKIDMKSSIKDNYFIIPNRFVQFNKLYSLEKFIEENSKEIIWKEYYKRRIKEIVNNIRKGALRMRWIRYKRKFICLKNKKLAENLIH